MTLTALIQEARSFGQRLLHSLLTLGLVQCPLTDMNEKAETSAMRSTRIRPIPIRGCRKQRRGPAYCPHKIEGAFIAEDLPSRR